MLLWIAVIIYRTQLGTPTRSYQGTGTRSVRHQNRTHRLPGLRAISSATTSYGNIRSTQGYSSTPHPMVPKPTLQTFVQTTDASDGRGLDLNDAGRSKEQGEFVGWRDNHWHFFLYSAFWDDRVTPPRISAIAMVQRFNKTTPDHLYCHVTVPGQQEVPDIIIKSKGNANFGAPPELEFAGVPREFWAIVVHCEINTTNSLVGARVSIRFGKDNGEARKFRVSIHNSVPLEFPEKVSSEHVAEFGTCTGALYGNLSATRFVEWAEMQRLLGVRKIVVYNVSVEAQASLRFRLYEEISEGLVELRQIREIQKTDHKIFKHWQDVILQLVALNDCIHRYMYQMRYIQIIDTDQFVMPTNSLTLREMVQQATGLDDISMAVPAVAFKSASFVSEPILDPEPDMMQPNETHFLRYRKHTPIAGHGVHRKTMLHFLGCGATFMHNC